MITKRSVLKNKIIPIISASLILVAVFGLAAYRLVKRNCDRQFAKPIDVDWSGEVVALFNSGVNYGIKKTPKDSKTPYFYAGFSEDEFDRVWAEGINIEMGRIVRVKGKWVGTTDAYKNSIFERCVPDVEIESIEQWVE